jgi:NADPH:quinone reductase-like Zn-dependent oxidoreductase
LAVPTGWNWSTLCCRGPVGVRLLASGLEHTDVLIRRRLYPQTMRHRAPFVLGYDVVGEIDQLGDGLNGFQVGDRVADMTVIGSNASYRTLRADRVSRLPAGVDAAEAATSVFRRDRREKRAFPMISTCSRHRGSAVTARARSGNNQ